MINFRCLWKHKEKINVIGGIEYKFCQRCERLWTLELVFTHKPAFVGFMAWREIYSRQRINDHKEFLKAAKETV